MNVQNMLKYTADLSQGITLTPLRMAFVRGEAQAHMFIITAYENHQKVDLTGAVVNGYMMRSDQTTLTFDGSVANGNAVISLPGAAYSVTGRFRLVIQATVDGMTTTLFYGEGAVSPSTTDVIAIPEEILMPSLENIEAQVEEMVTATAAAKAAAQGAVVRNLLDNSDFTNPINQRGATSVTKNWSYFIDRWYVTAASESTPFSVSADGVTIDNAGGASTTSFRQYLEKIPDGTYTACAYTNNTVYFRVFTLSGGSITKGTEAVDANGQIYIAFAENKLQFNLQAYAGKTITVKWAALYEGTYTIDTLPAYQPKGYAAELAECKRYFQRIFRVYGEQTGSITREVINYCPAMRITPTVSTISEWLGNSDSGYTVNTNYPLYMDISYTGWGNVTLGLSADL